MKARPSLAEDKVDALVEMFSEHIKFSDLHRVDEAKIDQKRLKDKGSLLEPLQRNLSFSPVVVKIVLKCCGCWEVGPRDAATLCADFAEEARVKMGARHSRPFQKSAVRC